MGKSFTHPFQVLSNIQAQIIARINASLPEECYHNIPLKSVELLHEFNKKDFMVAEYCDLSTIMCASNDANHQTVKYWNTLNSFDSTHVAIAPFRRGVIILEKEANNG